MMNKRVTILISILSFILSISAISAESTCHDSGCTIFLSQSAQTFPINGSIYSITLTSISNTNATLKINNEERTISIPTNQNNYYFTVIDPIIVDNLKISYINVFFNSYNYPGGAVGFSYSSAVPFCIDSDVDPQHLDGKNYYIKGQIIYGGYPNMLDALGGAPDYADGMDVIMERYCDPIGGPKGERYVCPNGSLLSSGVCSDILILRKPCAELWSCSDWSKCTDGKQIRTCIEEHNCKNLTNMPERSRSCVISSEYNKSKSNQSLVTNSSINEQNISASQNNRTILSIEEIKFKVTKIDNISYLNLTEENGKKIYIISGTKKARLFFLIPLSADVEQKIDAQTGTVISTKSPWWRFFALGI